ncbi:MAG: cytochrome P450 [Actinobacteria bacterium]|nr:cytochrome P450 [Actinomycetota bacterium]
MSTAVRYDPYAYATHEDPYPVYRRLRDEAPAYVDEERGFWALSRHDDVRAALDDVATFSSTGGITLDSDTGTLEPMLIEMDPPRHTALRALVSRAFTPRRVAELEGPVRTISRELISRFDAERIDGIGDFAARLPMAVISAMLGVPPDDQDQLRTWSDSLLHREEGSSVLTPEGIEGAAHLYGYIDRLVAARHCARGPDLVSALVTLQVDEGALTHQEVLGFCFLLIIAGNETTTKLLGNALYWLAEHPDQRALLQADLAAIPPAVEEVLRYDTSTQGLARRLTRDVTLHGVTLPAGMKGLLLFAAANRDERRWADPDRFDVTRNPAGHLAFGHGIHHCLGASLARLETRVALEELLPALGDYVVDHDGCERVHSGNVRGFVHLPFRCPSR